MARIEERLVINGEDRTGKAVRSAVKGQQRLGKATKSTSATMAQSAMRFRTGILQVAAAVGVYKAIGWSAQLLRDADNIGKVADKVGLTTDELQELRFAAELVNVQTTALDMGMQRFSRRLGEAAQGMGELMGIAEQYDIQLRDNNGQMRSNIDVLNDFAEVIKNAESEQEQLRIAFKLFDSEGAALVNMLKGGSVALTTMRTKAQELGIVVEEDLIRNAARAQDELKILSTVIKAQLTTAVAGLAPEIADASKAMTDFVINWVEGVKVIKDFFTVTRAEEIQRLEGRLVDFTAAVVKQKRILEGEGGFFESLGLTKVHERDLRDAEAAVVSITEKLRVLRADQQAAAGAGVGPAGADAGPRGQAEVANQQKINDALAALRQQNLLNIAMDNERELMQFDIAANARLQKLVDLGATEAELEIALTEERLGRNQVALNQELAAQQQFEQTKQAMQQATASNVVALLNFLAKENKVAAFAALALTKGLAIGQTIAFGAAAELRAMAELGPIAGPPAAASIRFWTKVNVGLIGALGLLQAAAISGGGGGGAGGGGGGAAVPTAPGPTATDQQVQAAQPGAIINITILGNILDQGDFARDIAPAIKEAVGAGSDFGLEVREV